MAHKYTIRKKTKHRTLFVPDGYDFVGVERDEHNRAIRVIFKKKR